MSSYLLEYIKKETKKALNEVGLSDREVGSFIKTDDKPVPLNLGNKEDAEIFIEAIFRVLERAKGVIAKTAGENTAKSMPEDRYLKVTTALPRIMRDYFKEVYLKEATPKDIKSTLLKRFDIIRNPSAFYDEIDKAYDMYRKGGGYVPRAWAYRNLFRAIKKAYKSYGIHNAIIRMEDKVKEEKKKQNEVPASILSQPLAGSIRAAAKMAADAASPAAATKKAKPAPTAAAKPKAPALKPYQRAGIITKKIGIMSSGNDVSSLQTALKGYFPAGSRTWRALQEQQGGEPDGKWGEETYEAVKAFQKDVRKLIDKGILNNEKHSLSSGRDISDFKVDGIFGSDTYDVMGILEDLKLWAPGQKVEVETPVGPPAPESENKNTETNESKAQAYLEKLISKELDNILG